jgi:hypothetical protein
LSSAINIATTINVVQLDATTNTINIVPTQTNINIVDGVGTPGYGVAMGGNTGDILVKKSNLSYDTEWTDDITVDSITYDTNTLFVPDAVGETAWSLDERTLSINKGGGVLQYVSQDLSYPIVRNADTVTLTAGTLVMVDPSQPAQGQRLRVKRMNNNGTFPSDLFVGMVIETITANNTGFVKWFGQVKNLNLPTLQPVGETWAEGDILWPSMTVAGGMTKVEPTAPSNKISVAAVLRISGNQLNVLLRPNLRSKLVDLHDVQVTNASNDQILKYSNGVWINGTLVGGVESVNGQTGNVVLNVGDLNDTNVSNLQTDDVLKWNGTEWINGVLIGGVASVTGDGVDNSDPANPVISYPTVDDIGAYSNTNPDGFVDATGAANAAPIQSVTGDGVDNSNVGNVVISYPTVDDIGAYSNTNPDGYVDAAGAASAAPVQSVNGQTGNVVIPELQRRHSFEQPYSYCGFADDGESEASNVWSITRINVALDGTATTGNATNVNWTNRSTHTYS